MTNYKLRIDSLLAAISGDVAAENALRPNETAHLFVVGSWSLTHQNWLENFGKTNQMQFNSASNCAAMLEVVKELVHLPYSLGVVVCQTDEDLDAALQLLKFFNSSHPDGILQLVFLGNQADVESALYLSEQSAGFKQLHQLQAESFHSFLDQALQSSHRQRSRLIERLVNIAKLSSLTPKEVAVMVQVLNGFANKEIALQMGNSSRTIELHRASLFEKMDVKNAIELSMMLHSAVRS